MTSAIPVRCSINWAMKPHIGSKVNLLSSYLPVQWNHVKYIWNNSYLYCSSRWKCDHTSLSSTTAVQIWISGGSNTLQSEEGQTPSSLPRNGHSRPWGSPSYSPLYRCMYHPGVRFSLATKVQECMGLTFVLYWSFSSPTYPFSTTLSCGCYCSCFVIAPAQIAVSRN